MGTILPEGCHLRCWGASPGRDRGGVVVTDSKATRFHVLEAYRLLSDRVRVVPCGYDAFRFRPDRLAADDGGVPYVLAVGNLLPHKNLPRLIEAVAHVRARISIRPVITGSGRPAEVERLRALAVRLGALVELRLYVPQNQLPALYRGARVVVLSSLAEGFGLTALEAFAFGRPVVAANASSILEVVGEAAILINPKDTEGIADAILRILTDEALRRALCARGLLRAAGLSWVRTARQVRAVLHQVIGG